MKLALGTVQFGLDYGIANKTGQVTPAEIAAILEQCRISGINTLDTAIGYGTSEERLGASGVSDMRVVSKLPPLPDECSDVETFVRAAVKGSLARLGVERLEGLLLHRAGDLTGSQGGALYQALQEIKADGLVHKIGVSIYNPDILETITASFTIDLVQAPFNVFDQRLTNSGWLKRLVDAGVEVHTRSAFLQGLLLVPAADRSARFERHTEQFLLWDQYLATHELTRLEGALGFVHAQPQIAQIVVGVDSAVQLRAIMSSVKTNLPPVPPQMASTDLTLIDPSTWSSD